MFVRELLKKENEWKEGVEKKNQTKWVLLCFECDSEELCTLAVLVTPVTLRPMYGLEV